MALAQTVTCGAKIRIALADRVEWLICTLPDEHTGQHYDDVFTRGWP